jgi:hypothetical protein
MVSIVLRRQIPLAILMTFFVIGTADYFLDIGLSPIASVIKSGGTVITAFTIIVAALSYLIRSLNRIINWKTEGAVNSALEVFGWLILAVFMYTFATKGLASTEYNWLIASFYAPSSSGIWSICVVLTVAVIFQKYRIRSLEGGLFCGGFAFLMLLRTPAILGLIPGSELVATKLVNLFETPITKVLLLLGALGTFSLTVESLRGRIGGFE